MLGGLKDYMTINHTIIKNVSPNIVKHPVTPERMYCFLIYIVPQKIGQAPGTYPP